MSTAAKELDVRTLAPAQRHAEIFKSFDALKPGESFVLVNDHYPKPLLYQFQAERAATFEWNVLEAGPAQYRVDIQRRGETSPRTVTECLQADHGRLEVILTAAQARVAANDFTAAKAAFGEFQCGLNRHIDFEEQVLFPVFEQATGHSHGGPTEVMRQEHVLIRQAMGDAAAALGPASAQRFAAAVATMTGVLAEHNAKEEQILYPMTDRAAGGAREQDDLVKRLQAN